MAQPGAKHEQVNDVNQVARFGCFQRHAESIGLAVAVRVVVAELDSYPLHIGPGGRELFTDFVEPAFTHAEAHLHPLDRQDDHFVGMVSHTQVVFSQE